MTGCSGRTTGATNITTNSAQLTSIGSCDQGNCSAYIRWRAVGTSSWINGPTITNIGAVSGASWLETATGLTPGTRYEYQACGKEAAFGGFVCLGPDGLTTSTDQFSTVPPPDVTPPSVTLNSPHSGTVTANRRPTLSGAAGEAEGDGIVVSVKIYTGTDASGTPTLSLDADRTGNSWSASLDSDLEPGTYTATAEQSDSAGNLGRSASATFTVDIQAPETTIDSGPQGLTNDPTPTFGFSASEAGSALRVLARHRRPQLRPLLGPRCRPHTHGKPKRRPLYLPGAGHRRRPEHRPYAGHPGL